MAMSQEGHNEAALLVLEQKFLELLESHNITEALQVLRNEIPNVSNDTTRLHRLASLIMIKNAAELRQRVDWLGAGLESRKVLLQKIFVVIKIHGQGEEILAPNRMQNLIQQSTAYQVAKCRFHSKLEDDYSLLEQHECQYTDIPTRRVACLRLHKDEVWIVKFSPNGNYLVSICKDTTMIVWQLENNIITDRAKREKAHDRDILCVAWNRDSTQLATASGDNTVKVWNNKCELLQTLRGHEQAVCCVVWNPQTKQLVSGGVDTFIIVWKKNGDRAMKLNSERSQEMHITNDGKLLVVVGVTTKVSFIDFAKLAEVATITEKENIISSFLSADEKFLLLNTSYKTPELHLWSIKIGGGANCELINRFIGFKQSQFSLRCCLGWREEQMIAQGSEDGSVYIWHRNHSKPLKILRRSNKRYYNNNNNKSNIQFTNGSSSGQLTNRQQQTRPSTASRLSHQSTANSSFAQIPQIGAAAAAAAQAAGNGSSSTAVNCIAWHPHQPSVIACARDDNTIEIWAAKGVRITDRTRKKNKTTENLMQRITRYIRPLVQSMRIAQQQQGSNSETIQTHQLQQIINATAMSQRAQLDNDSENEAINNDRRRRRRGHDRMQLENEEEEGDEDNIEDEDDDDLDENDDYDENDDDEENILREDDENQNLRDGSGSGGGGGGRGQDRHQENI